jgi:hypothetical protein
VTGRGSRGRADGGFVCNSGGLTQDVVLLGVLAVLLIIIIAAIT